MRDLSLLERLQAHGARGPAPLHMPGHKRNTALAPYLKALGAGLDVTELPGLDDLHAPEGILEEAMERCRRLYGAKRSFFLVNGATGGLLAAVRAAAQPGDAVLLARNCHKAVYHAVELCGLRPRYLLPPNIPGFGCAGAVAPGAVAAALAAEPDIRLVILTSPSYEGVCSDIAAIAPLCHAGGIPLLVDEAHGAHLGLSPGFPPSALWAGADLVVHSLHKTLPSLTQTAVLHLQGDLVDEAELSRNLGIFQTSSPSYLLLASLDGCVRLLETEGAALFSAWRARMADFHARTAGLKWLDLLGRGATAGLSLDPSKLVIGGHRAGLSGPRMLEILAKEYGLQPEMAQAGYAVAMTGMGDEDTILVRLAEALLALDRPHGPPLPAPAAAALPEAALPIAEAQRKAWTLCGPEEAVGCLSAGYLWAYPPGSPLLVLGERLDGALLAQIAQMAAAGVRLIATRGAPPETWAVLK